MIPQPQDERGKGNSYHSFPSALVNDQVRAVWNATAGLSERQRTVFLLRFMEDMNTPEIAEATGIPEGTVNVHLFRAVRAVRKRLGKAQ